MVRVARRLGCGLAAALLILGSIGPGGVQAASPCNVTITPGSVHAGDSNVNFTVQITNSGSTIRWVDITMPPANFVYNGNSVSGWFSSDHDGGSSFFGSSIPNGGSTEFIVNANIGADVSPGAAWTIQASTSSNGSNPFACEGSMSTVVESQIPNNTTNNITNVIVTNVTVSGASVSWSSDLPATSVVYYGLTSSYGSSSAYDANLTTSHQVSLTGLQADTAYHFQVAGTDANNNLVYSSDGTFTTLPAPVVPPGSGTGGTNNPIVTGTDNKISTTLINPNARTDKVAPSLILDTKLSGAYKVAPAMTGSAADNEVLAGVDYSIDGGKNWLPAESQQGQTTPKITYKITFPPLKDGNYDVLVRAVDRSGNTVISPMQTLVIDMLPPIVGGNVLSVGPQIIYPADDGAITALEQADQKITMSAVGGPIAITLSAVPVNKTKASNTFSLRKSADGSLWYGVMSFKEPGDYNVTVKGLDGASNTTERPLFKAHVLPRAHVYKKATDKRLDATATVFQRDPETHAWIEWDAEAFGQENHQRSGATGYGFYVPAGTYYVRYVAKGYQTLVSRSVTVTKPTVITQDIYLAHKPGIYIGKMALSLPWISLGRTPYQQSVTSKVNGRKTNLPALSNFQLSMTNQQTFKYTDLFAKPTVMTFVNSWSPATEDQLSVLRTIDSPELRILAVSSGESVSRTTAYTRLSGYRQPVIVDNHNLLAQMTNLSSVPTHYFLDRHGVVKKVMVGVLSKQEIIQNVEN